MRMTGGLLERRYLIVESLPASAENVCSGDDDIDLMRASLHRAANFINPLLQRRQTGRETSGDSGNVYSAAFERAQCCLYKWVVDADGGDFNLQFFDPEFLFQLRLDGMAAFGAQAAHALISVVAGEGGQIHAGDGAQKPRRLPFFFYSPARDLGLRPALNGAGVDTDLTDPIEIKRNADVGQ